MILDFQEILSVGVNTTYLYNENIFPGNYRHDNICDCYGVSHMMYDINQLLKDSHLLLSCIGNDSCLFPFLLLISHADPDRTAVVRLSRSEAYMALKQYSLALDDTEVCPRSSCSAEVGHFKVIIEVK